MICSRSLGILTWVWTRNRKIHTIRVIPSNTASANFVIAGSAPNVTVDADADAVGFVASGFARLESCSHLMVESSCNWDVVGMPISLSWWWHAHRKLIRSTWGVPRFLSSSSVYVVPAVELALIVPDVKLVLPLDVGVDVFCALRVLTSWCNILVSSDIYNIRQNDKDGVGHGFNVGECPTCC